MREDMDFLDFHVRSNLKVMFFARQRVRTSR
jgi:hypothetical protein